MTHRTIAVIGHVDHGKTALVKTLTGVDTDTLIEEQARGLTIALGFANRTLPAGQLHFIDAPGHADFIRTTAAGISGADAVLLVVSAVEGVELQTLEHVKLAYHFGIRHVIVALTKSDLVTVDISASRADAVTKMLEPFSFESSSVTLCSSNTGDGIDALVERMERFAETPISHLRPPGIYLPIDRVFSAPGAGTIVTGTLVGGQLTTDTTVRLEPTGLTSSVRGLQIANSETEVAPAGARVAVNLRNVDAKSIRKGQVLCSADAFLSSDRMDVAIEYDHDQGPALKHMQHVMVLLGTASMPARIRLYSTANEPHARARTFAQVEFKSPQIAYPGQRFVVRNPTSAKALTGGVVLDPNARLINRNKSAHLTVLDASLAQDVVAIADALATRDQGNIDLQALARLSRGSIDSLTSFLGEGFVRTATGLAFRTADVGSLQTQYITALTERHAARPCRSDIPKEEIFAALRRSPSALLTHVETNLLKDHAIRMTERSAALFKHEPTKLMTPDQLAAYQDAENRLRAMALRPAPVFDAENTTSEQYDLLDLLVWKGRAIRFHNHSLKQNFLLHTDTIDAARETLCESFSGAESFTTGDARAALNTNRKTIVPLLEYFDQLGVTRRNGNLRHLVQQGTPVKACASASSD